MKERAREANISGVAAPTPSQINEHAADIGAVYIRIERRGKWQEMSIINPELLLREQPIMNSVVAQIEEKLRDVINAGV